MTIPPDGATQDVSFGPTVEIILFSLGLAMTLGVAGVVVFLVRSMRREDRERARTSRRTEDSA